MILLRDFTQPRGQQQAPQEDVSFTTLMGSAFRQENDVVNLWQLMQRERPPVDTNFSLSNRIEQMGEDNDLWMRHSGLLATAQSDDEFDWLKQKIEREERDRQILASQGWAGMAAAMGAAVFSPVMFIPLVGAARGAKGVAQAFALGAAAGTAAEVPLFLQQHTRTGAELGFGIAAATVLGGLLGSTAMYLRRGDFVKIARDLEPDAPMTPRAAVLMRQDGSLVRVGDEVPLQMPAEFAGTPRQTFVAEVAERVRAERGRLPAITPESDLGLRAVARAAELSDPSTVLTRQAEASGLPSDVSTAWVELETRRARPVTSTVDQEARAAAQTRFSEALQRHGLDEAEVRQRIGEPTQPLTPEQAAAQAVDELAPAPRAEGSTVGARARQDDNIPLERRIGPDGKVTWEPIIDPAQARAMDPALGVGEVASWVNPIVRMAQQWDAPIRSLVSARHALRLSDGGISWQGSRHGLAPSPEGTVEARMNYYKALQARAYRKLYDEYMDYAFSGDKPNVAQRVVHRFRAEFNRPPPGKLSFQEFSAQLTDALNRGDRSPIPQIQRTAEFWRKEVYEQVNEAAQDAADTWGARRLYEEIEEGIDKSYMTHVFSPNAIAEDQSGFINMVADHVRDAASAAWERRLARAHRRAALDQEHARLLELDAEEARRIYDDNAEKLRAMKEQPHPALDEITDLRIRIRDAAEERFEELVRQREARAGTEADDALRTRAQEEVAEDVAAWRDRVRELERALPEDAVQARDAVADLRRQNRQIARSFGRLQERQTQALSQIERNEQMNLDAFQRVVRATQQFMHRMERLDDAALDAEIAKLQSTWDKAFAAARRGEAKLDKLEEDLLLGNYTGKGALEESMRQTGREGRASRAFDRLAQAMAKDRNALRDAVEDKLTAAIAYTNRVNNKRAERNALLREKIEALEPQRALDEAAALRRRTEDMFEELDERLRRAGGLGSTRRGDIDFSEASRDFATELANRIMGSNTRLAQIDAAVGVRSPMRARTLNIPYEQKSRYLEKNSEKVLDRYLRTMGSDIELFRAFGDRSGSKAIQDVLDDMQRIREHLETRPVDESGKKITAKQRREHLRKHDIATQRRKSEFEQTINRVRSLQGVPDNPNALPYRLGRFFINMNVPTMMGVAAITSIPDAGRAVMAHGLTRTFRDGWMPFVRSLMDESQRKLTRAQVKELRLAGVGIEVFTQQRARNIFDILEGGANVSAVERGAEYLALKTPQVALFGPWTDMMKTLTGTVTMARMTRAIEDVAQGRASAADIKYLANTGIDEITARRIYSQLEMPQGGTRYQDVIIPNTEGWTDYKAMRAWMAALSREDSRIVLTPGLERPLMSDASMLGRLVFQFRSFTMSANSKLLIAALQSRDMAALHAVQGLMFSLALGMISYYIWAMTTSERAREEMQNASWGEWVDQAIYRSGVLGAFSEAQIVGSTVSWAQPFTTFAQSDIAGRRPEATVDALLGPSAGKLRQIISVINNMDEPTQGTVSQARKLVPYQNVFWLRRALNEIEEAVADYFNLPESRR